MTDSLLTVTAPAASARLVSLAAVKADLGISDSASDTWLQMAIDDASSAIAAECRRVFGVQVLAETFRLPVSAGVLILSAIPVLASPALTVTEGGIALTAGTHYECGLESGLLYRLSGSAGLRTRWTASPVVVAYSAGWVLPEAGTTNLPPAVAAVAKALVRAAYGARGTSPNVQAEQAEGVGRVQYFDRGGMQAALDDAMRAQLRPFKLDVL